MTIQEIINSFDSLSTDDQDSLLEILYQHRTKAREAEILSNVEELKKAIATGTAKTGTVDDLIADLNED